MSTPALTARTAASAGIFGEAVGGEAFDGCPIADDHAVEAPVVAEDVVEEQAVAGGGDTVEVHVGGHEGAGAGFERGVEGWEVDVPQLLVGDVGLFVVAAAGGSAVAGEVFDAGHDVVGRAEVVALEARTWASAMREPRKGSSPAPSMMRPQRGSRAMSTMGAKAHWMPVARASRAAMDWACSASCGIPAGSHGDGDGIDGAEAVDDVEAEEERDVQAACSTATCWRRLISAASVMKRKEPTSPLRASDVGGRVGG